MDKTNIPAHVAIIMDGNGRWAKLRGLNRSEGHKEGIKRVREILKAAPQLGIKYLTLYAFSRENWKRPKMEVRMLMRLLHNFLKKNLKELNDNNIRLNVIGRKEPVPEYLLKALARAQELTRNNGGLTVNLAFNYGARQEIVDAAKKIMYDALNRKITADELDEEEFSRYLYTSGTPDPDLLIRTSCEIRLSNFLLWQLSYAEFYFTQTLWPDFKKEDLEEAIAQFQRRRRRYGAAD